MISILDTDRAALLNGDCLEVLRELAPDNIDAIVTDPPYGLSFMGKAWDYDVPKAEVWAEVLRVLKPGGHLLSFFGSRTYHRGVVQIEDAGFEIRDMLTWNYKTGMPKSLTGNSGLPEGKGTALKPSLEPFCLARKPFPGTVRETPAAHLNIDDCRVGKGPGGWGGKAAGGNTWNETNMGLGKDGEPRPVEGKWPANSLYDSSWPELEKFFFCAKPSPAERDRGCEHLPAKSGGEATDREDGSIGVDNPRAGAGRGGGRRNFHPTVKPIALMRWLVRLITPPGGTVLDPFTGSGTTGIAALEEGFNFLGIERDPEYCEIAKARLAKADSVSQESAA